MSTNVDTVVGALESGSISAHAGLTALLIKTREDDSDTVAALPYVIQKLKSTDENDIMATCLEILALLVDGVHSSNVVEALTEQNILSKLLKQLQHTEFAIRYPLLRVLTAIAKLRRSKIQSAAVCSGLAISQLTTVLADSREILRNETVLLFCELCIESKDIPVLFAFESGFELIISIFDSEGWIDGGIIVQDCLKLSTLILDNNINTQSFFREMGFLHKLLPLFYIQGEPFWDEKRTEIVVQSLKLMLLFVCSTLPANHVITMQNAIESIGLQTLVIKLVQTEQLPSSILSTGMMLLSKICTNGNVAQLSDSGVCLSGLLTSFDAKNIPLARHAGWNLVRAVIQKSAAIKRDVVLGIVNISSEPKTYPAFVGRYILHALLADDETSCWFACTILARCLQEPQAKEWLLTLKLATKDVNDSVTEMTLLSILFNGLISSKTKRLSILLVLASWSHGSPTVISQLLSTYTQPEYNCLSVLLQKIIDTDSDFTLEGKAVTCYILLLAVIQLPGVRAQLIPILQQLGDRFTNPIQQANTNSSMYFDDNFLLEDDFKKLVRDALPAAEQIMKIQIPRSPGLQSDTKWVQKEISASSKSMEGKSIDEILKENSFLISQNKVLDLNLKQLSHKLSALEIKCINYQDEIQDLTENLHNFETEKERLRSAELKATLNDDDEVEDLSRLQMEIKNHEVKASQTKIALTNLEKSISTYHEKLEVLEAQNVELRSKIRSYIEANGCMSNDLAEKKNQISQLEEVLHESRKATAFHEQNLENRICYLEAERDELLEENANNLDQKRLLQDKVLQLETIIQQQNEFIEQNESELLQKTKAENEIQKLSRKMSELGNQNLKNLQEKDHFIANLERELDIRKNALIDKDDLIAELKDIVSENKETQSEFSSIIRNQRQEIENLKTILADGYIEIPTSTPNLDQKAERSRVSSDSSTPTVVEGANRTPENELDSSHLQKPVHADVLLRIESTASESSNADKIYEAEQKFKTDENLNLIEVVDNLMLIQERQSAITDDTKLDPKSDDEEVFSNRRRLMCPSSGADVSADGEMYDNDSDVTETKRRKSKIELDRIRQLGEKQKIKEKSREREKPTDQVKDPKDQKTKCPERKGSERVPPSQTITNKPLHYHKDSCAICHQYRLNYWLSVWNSNSWWISTSGRFRLRQRNAKSSKPSKNGPRTKADPKGKKGPKCKSEKPARSKRK